MTTPDVNRGRSADFSAFRRNQPLSSAASYRTRILVSTIATLSIAILAANLPFYKGLEAIGWYLASPRESVTVQMVTAAKESIDDPGAPATRFDVQVTEPDYLDDGNPIPIDSSALLIAESAVKPDQSLDRMAGRRVFDFAQQMPEIVGGLGAYYIHIEYPEEALRAGIEGRLLLSFVVEVDGTTSDVSVLKSLHPACDSAAVRALRSTQFVPGRQNGRRVPVRMRLPVRFKLIEPGQPRTVPPISSRQDGA